MKTTKKTRQLNRGCFALAVLIASACCAGAQSADALIDKLVDKGILTVKEANDLREEADKNFTSAYSVKSGMPDWVSALKFNGDIRGRYEGFYSDAKLIGGGSTNLFNNRSRFRYRLRFGATAVLNDNLEAGLRLSSSDPASGGSFGGDPISGNTTMQDNGSKKFVYIDLAYGRWTPINNPDWQAIVTIGKMENPFIFSDMVFDADYTPEGAAVQVAYNVNAQQTLKLNAGGFMMDEIGASSRDPYFLVAQLRWDAIWNKKLQTSFGLAAMLIDNDEMLNASRASTLTPGGTNTTTTWTIPNQNGGNLRTPISGASGTVGSLINHYNPLVADLSLTYTLDKGWHYNAPFPIRLAGDYMYNPAASSQNSACSIGITLGKSGKKGLWDLSYRYKYLEGDAWFEEFTDSDFGAIYASTSARSGGANGYIAGTNTRGHIVKASYSPADAFTLSVTGFFTELIQENPAGADSAVTRLQVDAVWKF